MHLSIHLKCWFCCSVINRSRVRTCRTIFCIILKTHGLAYCCNMLGNLCWYYKDILTQLQKIPMQWFWLHCVNSISAQSFNEPVKYFQSNWLISYMLFNWLTAQIEVQFLHLTLMSLKKKRKYKQGKLARLSWTQDLGLQIICWGEMNENRFYFIPPSQEDIARNWFFFF